MRKILRAWILIVPVCPFFGAMSETGKLIKW